MKAFLFVLFHPRFWLMNDSYEKAFDTWLLHSLETSSFSDITSFRATINGRRLWIANYPYAAFSYLDSMRPSRYTIYKAHKQFIKDVMAGD